MRGKENLVPVLKAKGVGKVYFGFSVLDFGFRCP